MITETEKIIHNLNHTGWDPLMMSGIPGPGTIFLVLVGVTESKGDVLANDAAGRLLASASASIIPTAFISETLPAATFPIYSG